jgi:ethanolamine utilization microcompartment shell protein EutL
VSESFELRTFVHIDQMQPQYAALEATLVSGAIPRVGMSELFIEVGPANVIYTLMDIAVKAARVEPGALTLEREFGMIELHSDSQAEVQAAGEAILAHVDLNIADRIKPTISSVQTVTNVHPYQAALMNRKRRGTLLIPGDTLLVLELAPAAYTTLAANEAEKAADIRLLDALSVGRFGRLFISGEDTSVRRAGDAAFAALNAVSGKSSDL